MNAIGGKAGQSSSSWHCSSWTWLRKQCADIRLGYGCALAGNDMENEELQKLQASIWGLQRSVSIIRKELLGTAIYWPHLWLCCSRSAESSLLESIWVCNWGWVFVNESISFWGPACGLCACNALKWPARQPYHVWCHVREIFSFNHHESHPVILLSRLCVLLDVDSIFHRMSTEWPSYTWK